MAVTAEIDCPLQEEEEETGEEIWQGGDEPEFW
jgi:hypothetical protein